MQLIYAVINSGAAVSGPLNVTQVLGIRGIAVPAMTSGDLLFQASINPSSGSFARVREYRMVGSGDLRYATGPGSRFIAAPFFDVPAPYLRVEAAVPQTDARTLTLLTY